MDVLWLTFNMRGEHFLQYASLHTFSYKQHFYKQRQTKTGKKSSKC